MNHPKKPGFNLYQSRHCAYVTYSVKTWFLKILSVTFATLSFRFNEQPCIYCIILFIVYLWAVDPEEVV